MFDILASDIVVMQELKIQRKDLRDDMVMLDGWDAYFSLPKHKKGYSGVGIYTRNATCAPIRAEEGVLGVLPGVGGVAYRDMVPDESIGGYPTEEQVEALGVDPLALDAEGRCVAVEFPAFVLFGVYSPANSNGLRDDFRYGFICALDCRIRNLAKSGKRVVLVGDLNVSRGELDSAGAVEDCKKEGISHEQYISTPNRRIFNQLLVGGEVVGERDEGRENGVLWDTGRGFHPERKGMYTHWEQKINARPGNYGSRIDFVLVAESMQSWVKDADIQEGLLGSDHCPVYADFNDTISIDGEDKPMLDVMSAPGVFVDGIRQQDWKLGNVPPFSAKRMPEFDKRRSIKSMFMKKSESSMEEAAVTDETKQDPSTKTSGAYEVLSTVSTADIAAAAERAKRPPSTKRTLSVPSKEQSNKKQKTESVSNPIKGQKSLKGFFSVPSKSTDAQSPMKSVEVKQNHVEGEGDTMANAAARTSLQRATPPPASTVTTSISTPGTAPNDTPTRSNSSPTRTPSPTAEDFSAQIAQVEQSQRSWNALFTKPAAPLCEGHSEPCKSMLTKKKGSNQGRSFWMCQRPLGPSGEKEKGTAWRCGTFIWCSEWKPG